MDDFFQENKSFQSTNHPESLSPSNVDKLETSSKNHGLVKCKSDKEEDPYQRIGVHCVAGLGRAPFFVAMALVSNGCSPINAIELIRKNRKGSLNIVQANYILDFKKGRGERKGSKKAEGAANKDKNKANASCQCNIF